MEELILIGLILVIIFIITINKKNPHKSKGMKGGQKNNNVPSIKYKKIRKTDDKIESFDNVKSNVQIRPFILDIKFHNDYRDVMTAIDNMLPIPKKIFNRVKEPVDYKNGDYNELKVIASDFIVALKNQIKRVPQERNSNSGWDEALPDPNMKSGWDKFTEKIGIPNSLYQAPAKNGNIYLIDIFNNEKHETEDEARYITTMIIGKEFVDDQAMIQISVVKDKRCAKQRLQKMVIEEINILGYLSSYGDDYQPENSREPFYAFNQMQKNDVISNYEIINQLEQNFVKQMDSVKKMYNTMEPNTVIFGQDLPSKYSLESHQVTSTILDDMKRNYF